MAKMLTIGELARRANVATSLLRFYEKEKLLLPSGRTEAGYRLYTPDAERTLRFIRSAQRHGFALGDIRLIIGGGDAKGELDVMDLAEQRFLDIERQVTELLVLRHELEMFLDDVTAHMDRSAGEDAARHFREFIGQVCGHVHHETQKSSLRKLLDRLNCNLASTEWDDIFAELRGRHVHIWREDDSYHIQFADDEPAARRALERLIRAESGCEAHLEPTLESADDGLLFTVRGPNAFLFAQLFLALETAEA